MTSLSDLVDKLAIFIQRCCVFCCSAKRVFFDRSSCECFKHL